VKKVVAPRPTRKSPGRPTLDESLTRRKTLLAVALEEFLQNGFEGANLNAIARNSGIGRATIYRQYGSKEQLFRAAIDKRTALIQSNLKSVVAQPKSPEQILREVIERVHDEFTSPEVLAVVRLSIAEAPRFPELCAATWEDETRETLAPVVGYLQRLKEEATLDIGDPEDATWHLVNMAIGGFRFLLNRPLSRRKDRELWAQSVLQMILPALRSRKR
jgi:AcrR family transcriptional regulator